MGTIKIYNNTFKDQSSVINHYYEKAPDSNDYFDELQKIKSSINDNESLSKAIAQLTAALEAKDEKSAKKSIIDIFGELFTKTFTGVASAGLVEFLKKFL